MKAQNGMIWKATFDVDGEQVDVSMSPSEHIGEAVRFQKRLLSDLHATPLSKIKLVERWQEPIRKPGRPKVASPKIQKSIRLERDIIDWMVLEFGSVQKGVEKMAKERLEASKSKREQS